MSKSEALLKRHRNVIPSWLAVYYNNPIEFVEGKGRHVTDSDGNTYLDFFGGILTTMTGYAVDEVVDAIREQAGKMIHTSTLYLSDQMVSLAEKIAGLTDIKDAKVFFTTSGTEANDAALLIATCYRRSNQILALRNSYHGRSFTAQAITGNRSWSASSFSGLSVNFVMGARRRGLHHSSLSDQEFCDVAVEDLRDVISIATAGDIAVMIAEPIQGVGGFTAPPDGLYAKFKKVLDEYGILFISDEVQTGWGRTGESFWGYQAHNIVPDMMTFAKGVGNGLALGGVVGRGDLMDSLGANSISTFGGNPLCSAGALANIEYLLSNNLQKNALDMGNRLKAGLSDLEKSTGWIAETRGKGLMLAIEIEAPTNSKQTSAEITNQFMEATKARGLLLGKGGLAGNVLRIAPPLSVTKDEIDTALNIMHESVKAIS